MFDLIIRNAKLVDGTGAPAREADIAIKDGLIADVCNVGTIESTATSTRAGVHHCGSTNEALSARAIPMADRSDARRASRLSSSLEATTIIAAMCSFFSAENFMRSSRFAAP